jgi:hypothetical protein
MMDLISPITNPSTLYSRSMVLSTPCPVPTGPGIYGWFFKETPGITPTDGCLNKDDLTLLYVGIAPKNNCSTQNLRKRIKYHYQGNAAGSTLRRTLGILLTDKSDFPLRRVGGGQRMTFTHRGEQWLDRWMEKNAYVCWLEYPSPWEIEASIFKVVSLPLNIQDNAHHPFSAEVSKLRKEAMFLARQEPVAREDNQQRRM